MIKVLGADHINFVVEDLEEGQRFWGDLLGLEFGNILLWRQITVEFHQD